MPEPCTKKDKVIMTSCRPMPELELKMHHKKAIRIGRPISNTKLIAPSTNRKKSAIKWIHSMPKKKTKAATNLFN